MNTLIFWQIVSFILIGLVAVLAYAALWKAEQALGLVSWTDPDTYKRLLLLKKRLEDINDVQREN